MPEQDQYVKTRREGAVAIVTVDRPAALNALNAATIEQLDAAFAALSEDDTGRVVILTGAGEKSFVAGADIKELAQLDPITARSLARRGQSVFNRVERMNKPVIAAVNGFALGGGCELAMSCHIRIASQKARFGQPEVKLGLIPGYGGTQRLTRLAGRGAALRLILSGEMIGAGEALRLGLVDAVSAPESLLEDCLKLAGAIAANAPLALGHALEAVRLGADAPLERAQELEAALFGLCCATEDMREGTQAFVEKRPASFKGR